MQGGICVQTITLEDALAAKIVHEGHYFMTTAPRDVNFTAVSCLTGYPQDQKFYIKEGHQELWRLENGLKEGLKMWGEPTQEKLVIQAQQGFLEGIEAINKVARELYAFHSTFKQVKACSLKNRDYITTIEEKIWRKEDKNYQNLEDKGLQYWLASRVIVINSVYLDCYMFHVNCGKIEPSILRYSSGHANRDAKRVRPEATADPKLILDIDDCDGTKQRPWRCLQG